MRAIIVDNGSSSIEHLVSLVTDVLHSPTIIPFDLLGTSDIHDTDLLILSGSSKLTAVWHDEDFAEEIKLIQSHPGPIVGICLGMQLIAHAHGARLHKLPEKRYGLAPIKYEETADVFADIKYPQVFESHSWSVQKVDLPLRALATSGAGIEVFQHESRQIVGMQFHPEASDAGDGRELFSTLVARFKY